MDRNGKKRKASPTAQNSERSDLKASARDTFGKTDRDVRAAADSRAGKGRGPAGKIAQHGRTS